MSKETAFHNIGIDESLDWDRIRRLMIIGIFAAYKNLGLFKVTVICCISVLLIEFLF